MATFKKNICVIDVMCDERLFFSGLLLYLLIVFFRYISSFESSPCKLCTLQRLNKKLVILDFPKWGNYIPRKLINQFVTILKLSAQIKILTGPLRKKNCTTKKRNKTNATMTNLHFDPIHLRNEFQTNDPSISSVGQS